MEAQSLQPTRAPGHAMPAMPGRGHRAQLLRHARTIPTATTGTLARALGWVSIGLGLAALAAPRPLLRGLGMDRDDGTALALSRVVGLREIVCGTGLLASERSDLWSWARVAGDVMDLALLGTALATGRGERRRLAGGLAVAGGMAALDAAAARGRDQAGAATEVVTIIQTVTVNAPPQQLYKFWRSLGNLPRFMEHLDEVTVTGATTSHWRVRGPGGVKVEWDAEITDDQPGRRIAWRSFSGGDVDNSGHVSFDPGPGGRGAVVRVQIRYAPPAGKVGASLARLFAAEPGQMVRDDLRRLKQLMETGEITRSDASIHSGPHPARPSEKAAQP